MPCSSGVSIKNVRIKHNKSRMRQYSDLLIGEDVYNSGWERYAMAHNREIMTAGVKQKGSFLQSTTMRRSLVVWQSLGSRHNSIEGTVLPMTDEEKGNSNESQRYILASSFLFQNISALTGTVAQ